MAAFIVRRAIGAVIVLTAVSFITFAIFIVIPGGDPAERMAGKNATDENIANIRETWGFDQPFYVQYGKMMQKVFSGDLISYTTQQNVIQEIKRGLPATISLAVGAAIIWLFFGVLVGVISAVTAGRWSDRGITILALIGISMPVFWLGILARYYLGPENAGIFPDGGYVPLTDNPAEWLYHMILPWFVLAVLFIGFYGRVLRSNILDSINEDYVRTARAKGAPESRVMTSHILRNAMLPIVTILGMDIGILLGGAIFTESVFGLPGLGKTAVASLEGFDLPTVQGIVVFSTLAIIVLNLTVDLIYAWIDPRIRLS